MAVEKYSEAVSELERAHVNSQNVDERTYRASLVNTLHDKEAGGRSYWGSGPIYAVRLLEELKKRT